VGIITDAWKLVNRERKVTFTHFTHFPFTWIPPRWVECDREQKYVDGWKKKLSGWCVMMIVESRQG